MASAAALDFERRDYRALILYGYLKGLSVNDCAQSLHTVGGTCAPLKNTVYYWLHGFRRGQSSVCDNDRCWGPVQLLLTK